MKLHTKAQTKTFLVLAAVAVCTTSTTMTEAFTPIYYTPRPRPAMKHGAKLGSNQARLSIGPLSMASTVDDEITRLQTMAANLRAEAAALEAEQQAQVAQAAERAFAKFDADGDGQVDVDELKAGLEKIWKMDLPVSRVEQLIQAFDRSGDGVLQKDEMVKVEKLRNKFDALVRQEKEQAALQAKEAHREKQVAERMQTALELINDREPTTQDKIVSILPYLFPLLDGLQFVGPLVMQYPDNPLAQGLTMAYALYRSIPLGGFLAFFALSTLSGNPSLNRLIRFNMQQAIFLDIALFAPALLLNVVNFVGSTTGLGVLPEALTQLTGEILFVALVTSVVYAATSSLWGNVPDKIPFVSKAVEKRLPNFEIMNMEGRLLTKDERDEMRNKFEQKNNGDNMNSEDDKQ